ncbi:hypothetical protein P9222_02615 [Paenibacillus amylolyticus]|nr:hypothetical protein [Paenibacillus amylolyticus]WFR63315.1 hypothetical protein P9222_02615 [Paenibacillus amylolyticus]
MKKSYRPATMWTLACFTVVSVVLVVPWIMWQSQAPVAMNIMIIDKSKPDLSYQGHKGLVWLLNQQKIVQHTGNITRMKRIITAMTFRTDFHG